MPELTRIVDTLKSANGVLLSGRIVITPSLPFEAADGTSITAGKIEYEVVNGIVDMELIPTEDADPDVTYKAQYFLDRSYTETWTVPRAAGGPYTISDLRGTG